MSDGKTINITININIASDGEVEVESEDESSEEEKPISQGNIGFQASPYKETEYDT